MFTQGDINHITGDIHYVAYLLAKRRTLLTVLDCVFQKNLNGWRRSAIRTLWYKLPAKRASLITTISEFTRTELLGLIDIDPHLVRVVPVCISDRFKRQEKSFNVDCPNILQVGTGANKNLQRLFDALEGIHCRLTIIGLLSDRHKQALAAKRITYTNRVGLTEDEIVRVYQEADIVTLSSTYEGFGMPIVEGNAVGRPVITSSVASMPEVAGDAACLVDPFDSESIREGILRVSGDAEYRKRLIENGYRNQQRFRAERVAHAYLDLYREIAARP
jgi:glycosyltransferase involved in cell wall biosynthesis